MASCHWALRHIQEFVVGWPGRAALLAIWGFTQLYQSSIRLTRLGFPYVERPRGQGLSFPLLTSYGSGAPICPAFVCGPWAAGLDDVRNKTGHTNQRARLARWESRPVSHRDVVPWRSSLIECTLPLVGRRCRRPIP